jgi:hypothetical protein
MYYQAIEEAYEALYDYTMKVVSDEIINDAKAQFIKEEDESDIEGFNEWLLFHYPLNEDHETFASKFAKISNDKVITALSQSYRGIFEIDIEGEKPSIKDIFTKEDLQFTTYPYLEAGLSSLRIVKVDDLLYCIGDIIQFDISCKEVIVKYLLDQYNQYCTAFGPTPLQYFFNKHGMLVFKISGILNQLYDLYLDDEECELHVLTYAYKIPSSEVVSFLNALDGYDVEKDDDDGVFRLLSNHRIVAELEFENVTCQVLCNNPADLALSRTLLKPFESDDFVFMQQSVQTIDDLLLK